MSRDWEEIRRNKKWGETIAELVNEAEAAISAEAARREAVRVELREFVEQSPNFDDTIPIDKYDEIAQKLHKQLVMADMEDRLAEMEGRNADYSAITAEIAGIADDARDAAKKIGLARVRKVVDSFADAINSLRTIRNAINEEDDEEVARSVDQLVAVYESLQELVSTH